MAHAQGAMPSWAETKAVSCPQKEFPIAYPISIQRLVVPPCVLQIVTKIK